MMAKNLFSSIRNLSAIQNVNRINKLVPALGAIPCIRELYSKSTLGIDGFIRQTEMVRQQMDDISGKFKEKMHEHIKGEKSMVFTEDLKNMVHLASDDEDVDLVVSMIKRFNQQNKQMRFGNYIFGPVVMRLFYHLNKVELAYECFKTPELSGFFDQLISYQILMDLLYENHMYNEMLEVHDIIVSKQIEGAKYPRNIIILSMAACYKLNSKESLDRALKIWQELKGAGHFPMRRATTFCAGLAYNQGEPGIALEILSAARNQQYLTVRNLKVLSLASIGRVEQIIPILKSILKEDSSVEATYTFAKEAVEAAKQAADKLENPEIKAEFEKTAQLLKQGGHIDETSIDEQLCKEINKPAFKANINQQRQQPSFRRFDNRRNVNPYRPGLHELV